VIEEVAVAEDDRLERQLKDRRRTTFHSLTYGAIVHGRRREPRRLNDTRAHYVDWYDERLFVTVIGIFSLCCLDALFTLILVGMGAEEINPVMAALLEHGVGTFVYTKLAITGFGLVFLVVHAAFWIADTIRVSHILYALLGGYVTLCGYQLEMLARVF
jgi:hypothetical protein